MKFTAVLSIVAVLSATPAFAQCYNANGVPFPCGRQMYGYHVPAAPRPAPPLLVPNPSYNMGGPRFVPNNRDYDMEPGGLTPSVPYGSQAPQSGFEQYEGNE